MRGENNLGTDEMKGLVLRLAIPAMFAQFINVLYSIVDRIFIGNIPQIGETALAGVGVCGPVVTLITSFSLWIGVGGSPLMSIKMGEGKRKDAETILANCFLLMILMALLMTIIIFLFKDRLLMVFGASETTFPYANTYMTIYAAGSLFAILAMGMNTFITCQGYSKIAMTSVLIGAVTNIVLDPVFIFLLDLGVAGAAVATVIAQMISCIFVLLFLFGRRPPVRITFGGYQKVLMARILLTGLSPFVIVAFDSVLIIAMNMVLQHYGGPGYGDQLVTCNTIAQSFFLLVTLPLGGITSSSQPILGFNYGACQIDRIRSGQKYTLFLCVIFTAVMMLAAHLLSPYFVRLFTDDVFYRELSVKAIKAMCWMIIPLAVQYTIVDGFTGLSAVKYAITLSTTRKTIYFCLMLAFPVLFGVENVFFAESATDIISACISSVVYFKVMGTLLKRRQNQFCAEMGKNEMAEAV
ncbi:MATE family efflux transporter [Anaerotignum lactatifermentans]|uniref:Multidrug export protein MepA n=1 Tax=Anaerotignum lactatifermentans TaxID=160404 RepID=A0ABS2G9Z3_9FIRM|nr:MATE family efflux transporter [Anaerotignum lactatifermentans]MBM6828563.1 MATE family efflux transporter [Anaerotignum lactatifermentans]MBM6877970.1 MATE family efflux transporter [Anaerotignum lactatifermentans]MBM6950145.1 MATE family efflux transporter [Anaerotignum lactatifermentans]